MDVAVFKKLLSLNLGLQQVIGDLKELETVEGFDRGSMELFTRDAEQLKSGVNRYIGERMIKDADREAVRLDALHPEKPESEEEEP